MAVEIFKLFGSIFVNNDEANKSISKTDEKASGVASTLGKGVQTAAKWGAAIVGSATAAAGGMLKMAESSASTADHVDKMSQKIGLSRQAYQELDFICSQTGTNVDNLRGGMKTLTNQMDAAASGTASANQLFKRLGVSVKDDTGKLKSQEDMLFDCLTALQGVNDQTERAALANKLFGKSGTELMPLLNSQSGSIDEMKAKAHELGLVMSDELIDSGVGLTDSLDQIRRAFSAITTKLGGAFMPIVQKVADKLQDALPMIQQAIEQIMPVATDFLDQILPVLFEMGESILPVLFELLQQMFPVFQELVSSVLPVILELLQLLAPLFLQIIQQILPMLVQLITQLMPFIQQIITGVLPVIFQMLQQLLPFFMQIVTSILPILIQLIETLLPPVMQIVQSVLPVFQTVFEAIMPLLQLLAESILPIISTVLQAVAPVVQLLADLLSGVLGTAIENIVGLLQPIIEILNGIITFIKDVFQANWEGAWEAIVGVVKNIFNGFMGGLEGLINGAIWLINQIIGGINWAIEWTGWEIPKIDDVHLPRFRAGIDYVPNDKFPALLDAGEAVLTASEAEEYRKAKQESGTRSPFIGRDNTKTINQTFNITVNVEKIDDEIDIDNLAVRISEKLAEEIRQREGVYA